MPFLFLRVDEAAIDNSKEDQLFIQPDPNYYIVRNKNESITIRLRKRQSYPLTFCQFDGHQWHLGYGKGNSSPDDEFLLIKAASDGAVTIERDRYATLPLFYSYQSGIFSASNEYVDTIATQPQPRLSRAGSLESLAITTQLSRPYVRGINLLREQEKIIYTTGEPKVILPPNRKWVKSADVKPVKPADFRARFDVSLDYFINTRLENQNFAFEVSGGLDSATLPQYYTKTHRRKAPLAAISFPNKFKDSQQQKLEMLMQGTGSLLLTTTLDTESMFPLARMVTTNQYAPHYYEHIYSEASLHLVKQLQEHGVQVICGGTGGDELFGNIVNTDELFAYGEQERARRKGQKVPSFTTSTFRQEYIDCTPNRPRHALLPHAESTSNNLLGNNIFIRHDIWPVSPFIDANLYEWCQGIPAYLRANKTILRAYHQAYSFLPVIYDPIHNENFNDFFVECFVSGKYDALLRRLASNSVTAQLGYVDTSKLLALYDKSKKVRATDDLFSIYLWMSTEINLQHTPGLTIS